MGYDYCDNGMMAEPVDPVGRFVLDACPQPHGAVPGDADIDAAGRAVGICDGCVARL